MKHRLTSFVLASSMVFGAMAPMTVLANSEGSSSFNASNYSSYSLEQLESLIMKLQAQLAEMKKGSRCFVSDKNLSIGDGEPGDGLDGDVRRLQTFLKEKGQFKISATGYFGKVTRAALMTYQKSVGVSATGDFDGATREKTHGSFCKSVMKPVAKTEIKKEEKKSQPVGVVRGISLTVNDGVARWKVDGYSASGFKVVWSKNAGPTYPTRDGDTYAYLSDPSSSESRLEAFSGSGSYSVRVCEYLGGACGTYSNEAQVQL